MQSRRLNLLFIVNSLHVGGAEKHVVTLVNNLDTARFAVSFSYLKSSDALLPQLDSGKLEGRVFCCDVARKIDWHAARRLATCIVQQKIDVIVCTNAYPLLYGWLARFRSNRRPRIVEIFHTTELSTPKSRLQMLLYRPLFRFCDMLVYVCESQRQYWRASALKARHDTVITNGIDLDYFTDRYTAEGKRTLRKRYGFGDGDYVVGLCAALRPEKAHGDLLQAMMNLASGYPHAKCLFIGDGPERPAIEARIAAMGLASHIRVTGFIDDVRPLVAACDAMALVSHSETFSIAALEAMALGKPMIMSRVGGAAEQVTHGENGYLFARGDVAALTDCLRQSMDRNRCIRMGARARAMTAQRFSISAMTDGYHRLFSGLVHTAQMAGAGRDERPC